MIEDNFPVCFSAEFGRKKIYCIRTIEYHDNLVGIGFEETCMIIRIHNDYTGFSVQLELVFDEFSSICDILLIDNEQLLCVDPIKKLLGWAKVRHLPNSLK